MINAERNGIPYSAILLKCRIFEASFSGERVVQFKVGEVEWDTIMSADMCFTLDGRPATETLPTAEGCEGLAQIYARGPDWVRYWFAHQTEARTGLDPHELSTARLLADNAADAAEGRIA